MKHLAILSIAFSGISLSAAACHQKADASNTDADTISSQLDSCLQNDIVIELNPDTCYPSVEKLTVKIEVYDSIHSGEIDPTNLYESAPGILTFRGNPERTGMIYHLDKQPDSLAIDWSFNTATDYRKTNYGTWGGGTGWTGQPLFVEWPDSLYNLYKNELHTMNAEAGKKEIVFASLCSKLYFVDFETGKISREPINVSHPIKGTPMIDPTLNGLIYVGNGVRADSAPCGQVFVNLKKHSIQSVFPHDRKAWRGWNAYDSSPIRIGSFVFYPSENGTIYKWLISGDQTTLHSTMQFKEAGGSAGGMEASMCVWRNYGYVNDNHGNIVCFNLNTLKPVWRYDNHDDCDCTPVISHENGKTYLYAGCEVDRQRGDATFCYYVKLDALTGEKIWENKTASKKKMIGTSNFDGGYYSTTLLGAGVCRDLLFVNRVLNTSGQNGVFVAIDKNTGKDRYTIPLRTYAWSSPIGFCSSDGKFTIFTGDTTGNAYLIDGETGKILYRMHVGNNFESSPIAVGNSVILGSRGNKIFKIKLL